MDAKICIGLYSNTYRTKTLTFTKKNVLSKPVILENLKTIDVQHSNDRVLPVHSGIIVFHLNNVINPAHYPAEQTLIHCLRMTKDKNV